MTAGSTMSQTFSMSVRGAELSFAFNNDDQLDHVASLVQRDGLVWYEIPLPTVLAALVQDFPGVFLDVGANTGLYALLAAAANPQTRLHAFEPVPSIRERMERNLRANPSLAERIAVERAALSNRNGEAVIMEHKNSAGFVATSSTLEAGSTSSNERYEPVTVPVETLDRWAERNSVGSVSVMKVDVEGHEKAFLQGAGDLMRRDRPFLVIELLALTDFDYFDGWLKSFGYQDIALLPHKAQLLDRPQFMSEGWNHLFVPQERAWEFARTCQQIGLPID